MALPLPVCLCRALWHVLVAYGAEVMVLAVVDVCRVLVLQATPHRLQGVGRSHTLGAALPMWLVHIVAATPQLEVVIQQPEPSVARKHKENVSVFTQPLACQINYCLLYFLSSSIFKALDCPS